MDKLIEKVANAVWGKWISVPISILLGIIASILTISLAQPWLHKTISEGNVSYDEFTGKGVIVVAIIFLVFSLLVIINMCFVYCKNHVRKAKKGKTGIMVCLDVPNKTIYEETERKFGQAFQKHLFLNYDVIFIPYETKRVEIKDRERVIKLLEKKNCILLLDICVNTDVDKEDTIYDISISGAIIMHERQEIINKQFQNIINSTLRNSWRIEFNSKEMVKKLKVTASEMSLACQYVVGVSFFLDGISEKADNVLVGFESAAKETEKWKKATESSRRMRYAIYIHYAKTHMDSYQKKYEDEALDAIDMNLEKARECKGKTYDYCLNKAYYCIAKNQDLVKAKELINLCKQMNIRRQEWRYSEAFLTAFENKTIGSIQAKYKSAFRTEVNPQEIIAYTELIIKKAPERTGLYLALGLLYNHTGDSALSNENLEKYISNSVDPNKTREVLIKKNILNSM